MGDLAAQRTSMRLAIREARQHLDDDDQAAASMAVMARLARLNVLRQATRVAGYRAVRGELDIDAAMLLLAERGASVTVPRVNGEHLEFVRWAEGQAVQAGSFGIPEPIDGDVVPLARHDVVLAPLVAFDRSGNRLGQGGGFYDRALGRADRSSLVVIGVAHAIQEVPEVLTEPWDIGIDAVVTEDETIEFTPGCLDPSI